MSAVGTELTINKLIYCRTDALPNMRPLGVMAGDEAESMRIAGVHAAAATPA